MENEKKASKQPQQSSVCETEKHLLFFFLVGVGKIINITYFLFVFGIKKEQEQKDGRKQTTRKKYTDRDRYYY